MTKVWDSLQGKLPGWLIFNDDNFFTSIIWVKIFKLTKREISWICSFSSEINCMALNALNWLSNLTFMCILWLSVYLMEGRQMYIMNKWHGDTCIIQDNEWQNSVTTYKLAKTDHKGARQNLLIKIKYFPYLSFRKSQHASLISCSWRKLAPTNIDCTLCISIATRPLYA